MHSLRRASLPVRYGVARRRLKFVFAIALALSPVTASAQAADDAFVIAALGDSLTQGYGLPIEDGLVPQLGRWLDHNGVSATLINAGVSGDTTAGGLARLGWTLTPEVDGLIVSLGANDMLRGIPPSEARTNLDQILSIAQEAGLPTLLIGFEAPGNFGPEYKAEFDAIFPQLADKYGVALVPSFFAPLRARDDGSSQTRAHLIQADGLHPTADGVALVVAQIGPALAQMIEAAR